MDTCVPHTTLVRAGGEGAAPAGGVPGDISRGASGARAERARVEVPPPAGVAALDAELMALEAVEELLRLGRRCRERPGNVGHVSPPSVVRMLDRKRTRLNSSH